MADGVWKFFEPMRKAHLTVGKYDQYGKDLLDTDLFFWRYCSAPTWRGKRHAVARRLAPRPSLVGIVDL